MPLLRFRHALVLVASLFLWSCAPLGGPVDRARSNNHYFNATHTAVIWGRTGNCVELGCVEIKGADAKTFKVMNSSYAKDARSVFYEAQVIEGENPDQFRAVGPYAIGANGVYWRGTLIDVKDATSFSVYQVNNLYYGKDKFAVYCENGKISDDPIHFKPLDRAGYLVDQNDVYFMDGVCRPLHADPGTFRFLFKKDGSESVYAKDAHRVYVVSVYHRQIPEADAKTFTVLCTGSGPPHYALDKRHVYNFGNIVANASPDTFVFPDSCKPR
jgi:hypothetical protein